MRSKKSPRVYLCDACAFSCGHYKQLQLHVRSQHPGEVRTEPKEVFKCADCTRVFRRNDTLMLHVRNVHLGQKPLPSIVCYHCRYMAPDRSRLMRHLRKAHQIGSVEESELLHCDSCSTSYEARSVLYRHIVCTHDPSLDGGPHNCEKCGSTFILLNNLKMHEKFGTRSCVVPDAPKNSHVRCDVCRFKAPNRYRLLIHMANQHQGFQHLRKYECSICGNSFASRLSVKYHKAVHDKELRTFCKLCNKTVSQQYYREHMKRHSDNRPILHCALCDKSFKGRHILHNHVKKHEELECEFCGKIIHTKLDMRRHKFKEHPDMSRKPLNCLVCGATYAHRSELKKHQQRLHGGEEMLENYPWA